MPLADIDGRTIGNIIMGLGGLLVLLILGFIAVSKLRQMIGRKEEATTPTLGFTLADLRQMHRAGNLTDEEFARAKEKVVEAAKKAAERAQAPGAPPARDSADAIRARRAAQQPPTDQQSDQGAS
jgi:hypothetical protein